MRSTFRGPVPDLAGFHFRGHPKRAPLLRFLVRIGLLRQVVATIQPKRIPCMLDLRRQPLGPGKACVQCHAVGHPSLAGRGARGNRLNATHISASLSEQTSATSWDTRIVLMSMRFKPSPGLAFANLTKFGDVVLVPANELASRSLPADRWCSRRCRAGKRVPPVVAHIGPQAAGASVGSPSPFTSPATSPWVAK